MLTLLNDVGLRRDDRPAYRPFTARVLRVRPLTPHFTRVTFIGEQFDLFGTDRLDQRVKILFPLEGTGIGDIGADDEQTAIDGTWYSQWRALPDHERNPFRTYTVRAIRPKPRELDVDFVTHADVTPHTAAGARPGPAARWLAAASVGSEVVIVGPDARSRQSAMGIDWHPGAATTLLLAGDETAAPAICGILESLTSACRVRAFISVPTAADVLPFDSAADITVTWIARDAAGHTLESAVREWVEANNGLLAPSVAGAAQILDEIDVDTELLWDSPQAAADGDFYAWLAGESSVIKALRRLLVSETGIDRSRVAFMGYWREGKAEAQ